MSFVRARILTVLATIVVSSGPLELGAQHAYTPEEIDGGGRLFQSNCAMCHGAGGDAIAGADLTLGAFSRAADDEAFIALVRTGIAGTSMPPTNISTEEAGLILAYLRSAAGIDVAPAPADSAGDAAAGRALFETTGCRNCHRVNGGGGRRGPDLSRVAALPQGGGRGFAPPTPDQIRERLRTALTEPNAEVRRENQTFRVTAGGESLTGRLLNLDTHTVSILVDGVNPRTFVLEELEDYGVVDSPMPSFAGRLDAGQIEDLVRYLETLNGG